MTQRERLMAVFERKPREALPYYVDIGFWAVVARSENGPGLPEKYANVEWPFIEIYRDIGWGIRQDIISEPYTVAHSRVEIERKHEKDVAGDTVKTETFWHTPAGTLREVCEYSPDAHTWQIREYAVKNPSDIDILCLIHEDMEIAADCEGVYGARMTGGGFGGCAIILVRDDRAGAITETVTKGFERRFGRKCPVFATHAAQGARVVE